LIQQFGVQPNWIFIINIPESSTRQRAGSKAHPKRANLCRKVAVLFMRQFAPWKCHISSEIFTELRRLLIAVPLTEYE